MQVADLLSSLMHLLAHDQSLWGCLSSLHYAFAAKLCPFALSPGNPTAALAQSAPEAIDMLLKFRDGSSSAVRDYYLDKGAAFEEPIPTGLLYALAAVAHCGGSCSEGNVKLTLQSAMPACVAHCEGCGDWDMPHRHVARVLRDKAVRVCLAATGGGCANGAICACRAALTKALVSPLETFVPLSPAACTIELATCTTRTQTFRAVIAACARCSDDMIISNPLGLRLCRRHTTTGLRLFLNTANDVDTDTLVCVQCGVLRNSALSFSRAIAAAQSWAQSSSAEWTLKDDEHVWTGLSVQTTFDELACERSAAVARRLTCPAAALERCGYASYATEACLVFAMVEAVK